MFAMSAGSEQVPAVGLAVTTVADSEYGTPD